MSWELAAMTILSAVTDARLFMLAQETGAWCKMMMTPPSAVVIQILSPEGTVTTLSTLMMVATVMKIRYQMKAH